MHSFIHSFRPFLWRPFKSFTTQRRSRLQHGYCIGVSRRSAQATASKGLAQGPYMAARAGVEPTTLRLRVIASTNAPPNPTMTSQSALEFCPIHCPNGRLGQDLGFGGSAFALKLPELLNRNLVAVRAKLGQISCFPNGPQIWCPIGQ